MITITPPMPTDHKALIDRAFEIGMIQVRQEVEWFCEWHRKLPLSEMFTNFMEIGTNHGGFLHILNSISTGVRGKKISLDLPNGPYSSGNVDVKKRKDLFPGVQFFEGSSFDKVMEKSVKKALGGIKLDLLFIDGDHRFPDVDHAIYSPLVRPGGWVMFHDIADTPAHRAQRVMVPSFWRKLKGFKVEFSGGDTFGGIGLVRVEK